MTEDRSDERIVPPGFVVPWDIRTAGVTLEMTFAVGEYRYYNLQLAFKSTGPSPGPNQLSFLGDGTSIWVTKESADSDRPVAAIVNTEADSARLQEGIRRGEYVARPAKSGVMIPLQLRIAAPAKGGELQVLYDKSIQTWNVSAGTADGLIRSIDSFKLRPGRYHLHIRALQSTPVPEGVQSALRLTYRAGTAVLNDAP